MNEAGSRNGGVGDGGKGSVRRALERLETSLPQESFATSFGNRGQKPEPLYYGRFPPPVNRPQDNLSPTQSLPRQSLVNNGDTTIKTKDPLQNGMTISKEQSTRLGNGSLFPGHSGAHNYPNDPPSSSYLQPPRSDKSSTQGKNPTSTTIDGRGSGRPPWNPTSSTMSMSDSSIPLPPAQIPGPLATPRRNPNHGPPQSMRRGASSYYSSMSIVSPIIEESVESTPRKGGSFASSKVIPSSWGSGPPDFDVIQAYKDLDDEGNNLDQDGASIIRQASLGKKSKPSLRTIGKTQSGQSMDNQGGGLIARGPDFKDSVNFTVAGRDNPNSQIPNDASHAGQNLSPRDPESSSGYSRYLNNDLEKPPIIFTNNERPIRKNNLTGAEGGNIGVLANEKQHLKIDIEAVREAEARGSLTSLPDLIRRATRLATNLDRGKTASRVGMMDMLNRSGDLKPQRGNGTRNSGSLSDILAAFPPPGIATPTPPIPDDPSTRYRANPDGTFPNPQETSRQRYCCGMRRSRFIIVIIVLVLLIIAAILIPVGLIVIPRQQEAQNSISSSNRCQEINQCMNGGVSVQNGDSCGCVCVGGFSGPTCGESEDKSCVNTDVGDFKGLTLGNELPRLFQQSGSDFGIPLDISKVIRIFNTQDVSCTSANALVTFNTANKKRSESTMATRSAEDKGSEWQFLIRSLESRQLPGGENDRAKNGRNDGEAKEALSSGDSDSFGNDSARIILYKRAPASTTISSQVTDFSQIAVLFILQNSNSMETAIDAHDSIQAFFQNPNSDSMNKTMGSDSSTQNYKLDFVKFTITTNDGTTVGGK